MTCTDFESTLADYLDGALAGEEHAAVAQHAAECLGCSELMADAGAGLGVLERAREVEPPPELITRLAYLAPVGRTRDPFDRPGLVSRIFGKWIQPVLQPRLAMGMAMTILSFAMLRRCTGVETQQIQPADLSPVRVWGNVEDKALRARDQVVKYYDNLRIVYEVESHLKDLEETPPEKAPAVVGNRTKGMSAGQPANDAGQGASRPTGSPAKGQQGRAPGEKQP